MITVWKQVKRIEIEKWLELTKEIRRLEKAIFNDPTQEIRKDISGLLLENYTAGITNALDTIERIES